MQTQELLCTECGGRYTERRAYCPQSHIGQCPCDLVEYEVTCEACIRGIVPCDICGLEPAVGYVGPDRCCAACGAELGAS